MVQCVSVDAGFVTIQNLMMLAVSGIPYIAALKGNAGALHRRLSMVMGQGTDAPPPGGWIAETQEVRNKARVHRQFGRIDELGDCMEGDYRQVWRQRTTIVKAGKPPVIDDRLFITSLPMNRLTPAQCMAAIRAHWGIENDCFWTLDTQWNEDTRAWVKHGLGRESLAVLRLIAYNLVRIVRHRVLRTARPVQRPDGRTAHPQPQAQEGKALPRSHGAPPRRTGDARDPSDPGQNITTRSPRLFPSLSRQPIAATGPGKHGRVLIVCLRAGERSKHTAELG